MGPNEPLRQDRYGLRSRIQRRMRERGELLLRSLPRATQALLSVKHAFAFCDRAHTNEHVFVADSRGRTGRPGLRPTAARARKWDLSSRWPVGDAPRPEVGRLPGGSSARHASATRPRPRRSPIASGPHRSEAATRVARVRSGIRAGHRGRLRRSAVAKPASSIAISIPAASGSSPPFRGWSSESARRAVVAWRASRTCSTVLPARSASSATVGARPSSVAISPVARSTRT